MIRIAICDDEKNIRAYLVNLVEKKAAKNNIGVEIAEYASAEEYISDDAPNDIFFLDIELSDQKTAKDGMELAKMIRKEKSGIQPIIIFVTGYDQYVYDAFDVGAFHYLLKPIAEDKFEEVFVNAVNKVMEEKKQTKRVVMIPYNNGNKTIPISEIYYAESQNHKIILHTENGNIEYYAKMEDLENELREEFFRIHRGYLINLSYVDEYNKTEVLLLNGEKLLISKYKLNDFVRAYMDYVAGEI